MRSSDFKGISNLEEKAKSTDSFKTIGFDYKGCYNDDKIIGNVKLGRRGDF